MTPARQLATGLGAGAGIVAAAVLALTAWARCTDLGPAARVSPAARAIDASARPSR